ncbi:MoaD/ThiS family protein [Methanoregula formicica]|jgi:molybdopterin synthase sulfur carrier subunit|uniref:MoaD family protein n=1 Tax=Methanoregula formicica (strain DSM 22288 / NBRC 105244 / SMSP) TaxID=593750 RepID=L0HJG3_METFS|nr:MoaD family protein [Methanoregula formicica]AGB03458.1 MoaD family protein [Methanoregula formicica SMSP]
MKVTLRFFARFRELLGTDIIVEPHDGTRLADLVAEVAQKNTDGYAAIFDEQGAFREFVILMRNKKRVETAEAGTITVTDGDEIAVFPPVAGG